MTTPWEAGPLFNPGPVRMSAEVKHAMGWPEISHRDPRFLALVRSVRSNISGTYSSLSEHRTVAFSGSGATAVDACLLDAASEGGVTCVLNGGPYAERMVATLKAMSLPYSVIEFDPNEYIDVLSDQLSSLNAQRIALVHNDTSCASLTPISLIADYCRLNNTDLVVDAVSSFGCEDLEVIRGVRSWVATCSNKALEAAPGIAICLRPADSPLMAHGRSPVTLDLGLHAKQQNEGSLAFTVPTQVMASLSVALENLEREGGVGSEACTVRVPQSPLAERTCAP